MATLNVLLGAGFSANAGLLLVGRLYELLSTDYKNRIIRLSSSEWKWAEGKAEGELFSGRLSGEHCLQLHGEPVDSKLLILDWKCNDKRSANILDSMRFDCSFMTLNNLFSQG